MVKRPKISELPQQAKQPTDAAPRAHISVKSDQLSAMSAWGDKAAALLMQLGHTQLAIEWNKIRNV